MSTYELTLRREIEIPNRLFRLRPVNDNTIEVRFSLFRLWLWKTWLLLRLRVGLWVLP